MVRADGTSPGYILDQTAINTVLNQVYPVGAIYLSTVSTSRCLEALGHGLQVDFY